MFNIDTKFKEYIEACKDKNACPKAIAWMEKVDKDGLTFGEAIDIFLKQSESEASSSWAIWTLRVMYEDFDEKIREGFIKKIKDPMQAFKLCEKYKHFTTEDYQSLKNKYYKKLPNCEGKICH